MLFGSAISFTFIFFRFALRLGFRFKVYNEISRVQHEIPSDPALSQKRAVFPAFSLRGVTLGQMCKIGIHFIIYRIILPSSFKRLVALMFTFS